MAGVSLQVSSSTTRVDNQPRIYTYKVTFEEIPDWYWGVHKEKKYGEFYMGSPKTHAWRWGFYTPCLQICEFFPYTDEGWIKAREVEDRCILPDLNNPLCLNEHVGGWMSLEANRRGGAKVHEEKDELGRSVRALKLNEIIHKEKDELGRSIVGVKAAAAINKEKDELGRSVVGVKVMERVHREKDKFGRSVNAVKGGKTAHEEKDELGRSIHALKAFERVHDEKNELGRSVHGVESAGRMNTQKWKDPKHPELGEQNPGNLVRMQKRRGYPHGKENRVKVG